MKLDKGVGAALGAALLFGLGTPLAKPLLGQVSPWLLAALLYLGSGLGLWLIRRLRREPAGASKLAPGDAKWLAGAILAGGVLGPVLLMLGLSGMSATGASLLLNAEGVLTALVAWFVFKENFDRRIALGMLAIAAGSLLLTLPTSPRSDEISLGGWPALAVIGACLAWAVDNNLTRKVALADAGFIAMVKGLVAGSTNLVLALGLGASWPGFGLALGAGLLGFASYGASLVLFVIGLRHLGAARTGAYFSIAPFVGAVVAIGLLGESVHWTVVGAGGLMALGVWLHLTEHHEHEHRHEAMEHEHEHVHGEADPHHEHSHPEAVPTGTHHTHWHRHEALSHRHRHYPDAHHSHEH